MASQEELKKRYEQIMQNVQTRKTEDLNNRYNQIMTNVAKRQYQDTLPKLATERLKQRVNEIAPTYLNQLEEMRQKQNEEDRKRTNSYINSQEYKNAKQLSDLSKQKMQENSNSKFSNTSKFQTTVKGESLNKSLAEMLSKRTNTSKEEAQKIANQGEDAIKERLKQAYIDSHSNRNKEINLPDGVHKVDDVKEINLPDGTVWHTNMPDRFNEDNSTSAKLWRNTQAILGNTYKSAETGVANFMDYSINVDNKIKDVYENTDNAFAKIALSSPRLLAENLKSDEQKARERETTDEFQDTLQFTKQQNAEIMQQNVDDTTNRVTRKVAQLSESMGNNLLGAGLSAINPVLGTTYFIGSASGSYYDEAIERGMNKDQALLYGTIMGTLEGVTEEVLAGKHVKAFKDILAGEGLKNTLGKMGIEIGENFLQEAVMPGLSELTAYGVAGKDAMNYDLKNPFSFLPKTAEGWWKLLQGDFSQIGDINVSDYEGWRQLMQQSFKEGIDGGLSAGLMMGISRGVPSAIKLTTDISNGKKVNVNQISQVMQDCQNAGIDMKGIMGKEISYRIQQTINEQQTAFYNNKAKYSIDIEENSLKNKSYTLEELDNDFADTLNGVETSDGNVIYGYFDKNNNLVVEKAKDDGFGEKVLDTITVEQKDGKFSGKKVNDAIKKLSEIADEAKPIDRQIDIENNVQNPIKNQNTNQQQQITQAKNKNGLNQNVEGQNLDNVDIKQRVQDFLKKNNKKISVNDFMDWAMTKNLENENITDSQQIELYNLIKDIQNTKYATMAGINSETRNIDKLNEAIQMEREGKSAEEIYQQTGYFKGNEGKWRYEIGNENAYIETNLKGKDLRFRDVFKKEYIDKDKTSLKLANNQDDINYIRQNLKFSKEQLKRIDNIDIDLKNIDSLNTDNNYNLAYNPLYLSDILKNNDELFEAYPFLKDIEIKLPFKGTDYDKTSGTLGYVESNGFNSIPKSIYITEQGLKDNYGLKKILLHEIQHAIQSYEGFSNGSAPEMWLPLLSQEVNKKVDNFIQKETKNLSSLHETQFKKSVEKLINSQIKLRNLNTLQENNKGERISQILTREGYPNEYVYKRVLTETIEKAESIIENYSGIKAVEKVNSFVDDYANASNKARRYYKNTAGEIEAREVEKRSNWSEEKRKAKLPFIKNRNTVYSENIYGDYKNPKSLLADNSKSQDEINLPPKVEKKSDKVYNKITAGERKQIISEVMTWRINEEDGIHYIDLSKNGFHSYIYEKNGDSIIPIAKIIGSEEFLNAVRKGVEDGTYKKSETIDKWVTTIKNETKNNRSSNASLPKGKTNNRDAGIHSGSLREESSSNRTRLNEKNSRDGGLEKSSSFNLPKTDIKYDKIDTSTNTAENEVQRKINRSMTMEEAKDMIQRAFVVGEIDKWFEGEYKNGDEWLNAEGADSVALVIDNDYNLQNKYYNSNEEMLNEEYTIEDVIEAYQNGTLTGKSESSTQRLDTSKDTGYKDNRFYAPQDIKGGKNLYDVASQKVTNANRQKVYKARADFILNAHNEGYIESLGLNQKEVNQKLRSWANYPKNAMDISNYINKNVALENRWTGIENSSIVNALSVTNKQLDSLVKEVKGSSNQIQRTYIANTMLAIDTHMDYSNLTFDFEPNVDQMGERVLGDYSSETDTIRIKVNGQNTVAHEIGHYIDHLLGRKLGDGFNLGLTSLCRTNLDSGLRTYTDNQKQFLRNFNNFLTSIENTSDIGSTYKMSSNEVFARFTARFVEWTKNVATSNRYGYEAKWYNDNFTQGQYYEFAKLLQEYSMLETTGQVSNKIKRENSKTYDQRIDDIFDEFTNFETNLPTKETINQSVKKDNTKKYSVLDQNNKEANLPPSNISSNNQYKDTTTKVRKHYKSIIESQYTTDEARAIAKELMGSDTYIPETNKSELERADNRISQSSPESELSSLMSRATTGDKITPVDIAVGERLIQYYSKTGNKTKLQDAIQATAMAGTTAGQTVQAMALLNHMTPEGQAVWLQRSVDKMNNDLKKSRGAKAEQLNLTAEMLEKITNSATAEELNQNLDEVYKELGQQVTKTTLQKIDSWRYFSMLANPRTHIRNIVGNVSMAKVQTAKNKVAGVIESVASKFNPNMERTHTIVPASKAVKQFAKNDIKNVSDWLGLTENKYTPKSRIEGNMRTFKHSVLENTIGKAFKLNDNALSAEDGWGLKSGYVKAMSEYMTANKLNPDNITDTQLNKARQYAVQQAKEATFHQDCQLATLVNQLANKNKFAKYTIDALLPFKKTPMNIAKAGMEYSPMGLAKSMVYDTVQLRKGNITVNQYIDNISKGLTGTGIALVGYALASMGIIKASGGDDDKEKYEQNQGKQTYSIQIGDNTYSLDWLAPTAIPLFIGAEIHELAQSDSEKKTSTSSDEDTNYNRIVKSATNILDAFTNSMNPMMEMSMLSGLTSALKSYEQGSSQMIASMGTNAVQSYVNQFFPTAMGQIAKTTDKYERSTTSTKSGVLPKAIDTTKNQIMAKIPGLRQKLPVKTDIWGNEMEQSENIALRAIENAILPYNRKKVSTSNVDKELLRLYEIDGNSSVIPDASFSKDLTFNGQKYRMTSEEYSQYRKAYGSKAYSLINKMIKSSEYQRLSDDEKQKAIEKVYTYVKEYCKNEYAKDNKISNEETKLYKTVNQLNKSGENESSCFSYMAKTANIDGEKANKKKMQVLADSNYSKTAKAIIYENTLGSDDSLYNDVMKSTGIDINEYLNYKLQEFTSDKQDDGTEDGKTISGSKKAKVYNYVNNMKITGKQRMLLLGTQYKLTNSERQTLANYVKDLNITKNQKLEIYKKLQGFTVYKDGRVTY